MPSRETFDLERSFPGGLAVATVFATAGFAAVSGASTATAAVFSRVAIPEMLKYGYDPRLAAGVVAAGGTLASLIPPSAILVIYAIIVEDEQGKPVAGADVYVNGQWRGATNAEGKLRTFLQVGDAIVAVGQRSEEGSLKSGHNQDSTQNWAYRVYLTSLDVPVAGEPVPYTVLTTVVDQVLIDLVP